MSDFLTAGGPNVINLLDVAGEQQVMLRVIVAEVNRTAARSIGMNFSLANNQGLTVFTNTTGQVTSGIGGSGAGGGGSVGAGFGQSTAGGGAVANLTAALNNGKIQLAINALRTLNYAKSLAEPTLVTLNGQTANFQAGGEFPVPIVAGLSLTGLQGVSFVPFGVQVSFTPFITDRDRVRLVVSANVSTRDVGIGTSIGGSNVSGLDTRNFNTTVELRQGETLAVAGLLQTNLGADSTRIPYIGDLPILGALTGLSRVEAGEQELVIFITPELVHPLEPDKLPALPGSDLLEPTDLEFYLLSRLESHCPHDFRSTIRTDLSRIVQYRDLESHYMSGPSGYAEPP